MFSFEFSRKKKNDLKTNVLSLECQNEGKGFIFFSFFVLFLLLLSSFNFSNQKTTGNPGTNLIRISTVWTKKQKKRKEKKSCARLRFSTSRRRRGEKKNWVGKKNLEGKGKTKTKDDAPIRRFPSDFSAVSCRFSFLFFFFNFFTFYFIPSVGRTTTAAPFAGGADNAGTRLERQPSADVSRSTRLASAMQILCK